MNTTDSLTPVLAEVDLICEQCEKQITVGEDYFYDEEKEEIICETCAFGEEF